MGVDREDCGLHKAPLIGHQAQSKKLRKLFNDLYVVYYILKNEMTSVNLIIPAAGNV